MVQKDGALYGTSALSRKMVTSLSLFRWVEENIKTAFLFYFKSSTEKGISIHALTAFFGWRLLCPLKSKLFNSVSPNPPIPKAISPRRRTSMLSYDSNFYDMTRAALKMRFGPVTTRAWHECCPRNSAGLDVFRKEGEQQQQWEMRKAFHSRIAWCSKPVRVLQLKGYLSKEASTDDLGRGNHPKALAKLSKREKKSTGNEILLPRFSFFWQGRIACPANIWEISFFWNQTARQTSFMPPNKHRRPIPKRNLMPD